MKWGRMYRAFLQPYVLLYESEEITSGKLLIGLGFNSISQEYLSAMCFGDFYTRSGLDVKTRELLTLCILSTLGGCESQVKAHVQGNLDVGNDKEMMIEAITQCLPYIGFPRTLNALNCVNDIIPEKEK
jgi:alkylhydroperoxidase/carboxymuconolactone decarboxylase family protein YurZ